MGKKYITKDDILNAKDIDIIEENVKEWGGTIRMKVMSARERQILQRKFKGDEIPVDLMEDLLSRIILKPDSNELMFTPDDIVRLAEKSSLVIGRLFQKAAEINGLTAQSVEELRKN